MHHIFRKFWYFLQRICISTYSRRGREEANFWYIKHQRIKTKTCSNNSYKEIYTYHKS
uniref:SR-related CTD associated factor 11 n=1 Tax=Rousettus aegyptiacus TaxID=9407 RepID=A0A7J8JLF5_ROUAE|nr:SR-related CTD associated factor 11 [Rousettus aegyptiacus]